MKHYGDITKINGREVPAVDILTGGSPCQDLSIAGTRSGLQGSRSGLFMEQIRIVKEMRQHDKELGRTGIDVRPRFLVWENVCGALSSGTPKGGDFQIVLTEIARIVEPNAPVVPLPKNGKWTKSGCVYSELGNWSVAWRVHDAQFWGVAKRRRRVSLVGDFSGMSAAEVLFEREESKGVYNEGGKEGKNTAAYVEKGFGDSGAISFQDREGKPGGGKGILIQNDRTGALTTFNNQCVAYMKPNVEPIAIGHDIRSARFTQDGKTDPLTATDYKDPMVICYGPVARTLMPIEYERLQGYPDEWTRIGEPVEVDVKDYEYTYDDDGNIIGKAVIGSHKETEYYFTGEDGEHKRCSDAKRFKALGNSIALPFWQWMAQRIVNQYPDGSSLTMASLFDGIGGFPLVFSRVGVEPVWASEIEEFPIAVTKYHFPE